MAPTTQRSRTRWRRLRRVAQLVDLRHLLTDDILAPLDVLLCVRLLLGVHARNIADQRPRKRTNIGHRRTRVTAVGLRAPCVYRKPYPR